MKQTELAHASYEKQVARRKRTSSRSMARHKARRKAQAAAMAWLKNLRHEPIPLP